jgi:hypothetical protein
MVAAARLFSIHIIVSHCRHRHCPKSHHSLPLLSGKFYMPVAAADSRCLPTSTYIRTAS